MEICVGMPFRLIHAIILDHKIICQDINRIAIEAINSARVSNEAEDIIKTGRTRPIKTNPIDHDMDNGFTHPKIMMLVSARTLRSAKPPSESRPD